VVANDNRSNGPTRSVDDRDRGRRRRAGGRLLVAATAEVTAVPS